MTSELSWGIRYLDDINDDHDLWGGKAVALHKALLYGAPIPRCVILPSTVHAEYGSTGMLGSNVAESLKSKIASLCPWRGPLVVRSSANFENTPQFASCGLFESVKVQSLDDVPAAVEEVWASLHIAGVMNYLRFVGLPISSVRMAVIVQEYFDGSVGGVIHTKDQVGSNKGVMVEYVVNKGMNAVVDGNDNAECSIFDRAGNIVEGNLLSDPYRALLRKAVAESIRLEECFGSALEIEFQLDDSNIAILQVREVDS